MLMLKHVRLLDPPTRTDGIRDILISDRKVMKIGTELDLVREAYNSFDPYAVAIYFGDYKLGYIPRGKNQEISKYLDMGFEDIYEVRITRLTPELQPEQQIEVNLYLKNQN